MLRSRAPKHGQQCHGREGLLTGTRTGRSIVYTLHDTHVAQLLNEAIYHIEHLRLGVRDTTA